jgi:hypothetical protein
MDGRPTLPSGVQDRPDVLRAASDALDEKRAASMADEGGRSGAYVERQSPLPLPRPWYREVRSWLAISALSIAVVFVARGWFQRRRHAPRRSRQRVLR